MRLCAGEVAAGAATDNEERGTFNIVDDNPVEVHTWYATPHAPTNSRGLAGRGREQR